MSGWFQWKPKALGAAHAQMHLFLFGSGAVGLVYAWSRAFRDMSSPILSQLSICNCLGVAWIA